MTRFAIISLILACSALADKEFYRGDTTYYEQPNKAAKPRKGFITFPPGTYSRSGVGMGGGEIALRIGATEVQIALPVDKHTLSREERERFLSGEMITLPSKRQIQFFRPTDKELHRLLIYAPSGGLQRSIDLIEKKI